MSCRLSIKVGNNVLIGRNVYISDHNAHRIDPNGRHLIGETKMVIIDDNVWIGNNVMILPGSYIGKNSIIGGNSVVKGYFPDNVIMKGNLGRVVKFKVKRNMK